MKAMRERVSRTPISRELLSVEIQQWDLREKHSGADGRKPIGD